MVQGQRAVAVGKGLTARGKARKQLKYGFHHPLEARLALLQIRYAGLEHVYPAIKVLSLRFELTIKVLPLRFDLTINVLSMRVKPLLHRVESTFQRVESPLKRIDSFVRVLVQGQHQPAQSNTNGNNGNCFRRHDVNLHPSVYKHNRQVSLNGVQIYYNRPATGSTASASRSMTRMQSVISSTRKS